ncbi:Isopropylmalate dehydrogenase-like domain-containing protein [Cytidiella melzeri]|nr:Isopropylmalate dehydrogenase-like domain-containing protein [Cytidiella melzeri]
MSTYPSQSNKKIFHIVILPGDGIGPEVVAEATRFGGCSIDSTGEALTGATLQACSSADAILMGFEQQSTTRTGSFGFAKSTRSVREHPPANFASDGLLAHSPLKASVTQGVDMIVIRELIGGAYLGTRKEMGLSPREGAAWGAMIYSVSEVQRITRVAAQVTLAADPPLPIHSIDKANVLASSRLWRKVATETLLSEFPQLKLDHHFVDSASMLIVSNLSKLNGVILTENLFGNMYVGGPLPQTTCRNIAKQC